MLSGYKEARGVLIKKYRNVFGYYIFIVEEDDVKTKIKVGKAIYNTAKVGTKWTMGHIGKQLINIRPGICDNPDERS